MMTRNNRATPLQQTLSHKITRATNLVLELEQVEAEILRILNLQRSKNRLKLYRGN